MHKIAKIIKTALLVAGLIACGSTIAGGRGAPALLVPMILKTAMDMEASALIITGRNFGATTPTVTLANQVLEVKRFSEYEVVASLPRGLTAATYGVTVTTNGRNGASSNLFSAALPALTKN